MNDELVTVPAAEESPQGVEQAEEGQPRAEALAPRNVFEARRQARVERLRERADRKREEGGGHHLRADSIASFIPPGQPILVGHHSEKRHRRDLERIRSSTQKGFDALKEAGRLEQRADAAEGNTAIFTEDPDAPAKLEQRIAELERLQSHMREVNKRIRAGKSLTDLGISPAQEEKLKTPDFLKRVGYPDYALKNNNANIRRLKLRLQSLALLKSVPAPADVERNGIRVVENVEDNRVQIFFPGKPAVALRNKMKSFGFRWSPFNKCWQRHRSTMATHLAHEVLNEVAKSAT